MKALDSQQTNRALGVLPGLACGDALGAAYEFMPPQDWEKSVSMEGGGAFGWGPGEWTDDTSQAIILNTTCVNHQNIFDNSALDETAQSLVDWSMSALDVGIQTRSVISAAMRKSLTAPVSWMNMHQSSVEYARATSRSSGNGSLMRIAGIFPAALEEGADVLKLAEKYSGMTHSHQDAVEACALWLYLIRKSVFEGSVGDLSEATEILDSGSRNIWKDRIADALKREPWEFDQNGWVVETFQAAIAAIHCNQSHPFNNDENEFSKSLEHAVRAGGDTDTVAAVAGSLLGALHGLSAIPYKWTEIVHGWPDFRFHELLELQNRSLSRRCNLA
jgi:ADP-ribosyl-[dinitrogen reductase] hydrolase